MLSSPVGEQHRQTTEHLTLLTLNLRALAQHERRRPRHLRRGPRHHTRRSSSPQQRIRRRHHRRRNRHRHLPGPSRPGTGDRRRWGPGNPAPHDTIPHDTVSAHHRRRNRHRTRRTTPRLATTTATGGHRPATSISRPRGICRPRRRGIPTTTIGMSHTRRQHRTHTQTQTDRPHPKPRIWPAATTTRPTTTSPAVPSLHRNHLSAHSPIHQPIPPQTPGDRGVDSDATSGG
jgi:hypothetical protein